MGDTVNQDTGNMRVQGNSHYAKAPGQRERAKVNQDYEAYFYDAYGYGAYAWLAWVGERFSPAHQNAWNRVADGNDGVGDSSYKGASEFEIANEEGGASVRRAVSED